MYPYLHHFPPRLVFSVRGQIINEQAGRKESATTATDMFRLSLRASRYSGCEIFFSYKTQYTRQLPRRQSLLMLRLISRYVRQTNKCTEGEITRKEGVQPRFCLYKKGSTLGLSHPLFVSCGSCMYFGENCSRRNVHLYFFY